MTLSMTQSPSWTLKSIDDALVRINAALSRLRCRRDGQHDAENEQAVEEARQLKLYLEQNPSACTKAALNCCQALLEAQTR